MTTAAGTRKTCGGGCVGVRAAARRPAPPAARARLRDAHARAQGWCARLSKNARERACQGARALVVEGIRGFTFLGGREFSGFGVKILGV